MTRVGRVALVLSPSFLLSWYCSPFPVYFVSAASGICEPALGVFPPFLPFFPFFFLSFVVTKSIAFSTSIHVGRLTVLPLFYGERSRRVVSERERVALGHNIVPTLSIVMETPHSMVVRG